MSKIGIVAYGAYLPKLRVTGAELEKAWGNAGDLKQKTVPDFDEDTITMAVEAAGICLNSKPQVRSKITFLSLASTNYPYNEKLQASTVQEALGLKNNIHSFEFSGSTRCGLEALENLFLVLEGSNDQGLLVATDSPQTIEKNSWGFALGAGAGALILGKEKTLATIEGMNSYINETIGIRYRYAGNAEIQDSGIPSYKQQALSSCVVETVKGLLEQTNSVPADFRFVAVGEHEPKLIQKSLKSLGFSKEQTISCSTFDLIGDAGAAGSIISAIYALELAQPGDNILLISYGYGSGATALKLVINDAIQEYSSFPTIKEQLDLGKEITYDKYLKLRKRII